MNAEKSFAVKDSFSIDLEVPYENNGVRMVINDTMPWTDDETVAAHLDTILKRTNLYLEIAKSDRFRQKYPRTSLDKFSIALRLRHLPLPSAELILCRIADDLANLGVRFKYGWCGEKF